jgi:hypothetical protein
MRQGQDGYLPVAGRARRRALDQESGDIVSTTTIVLIIDIAVLFIPLLAMASWLDN